MLSHCLCAVSRDIGHSHPVIQGGLQVHHIVSCGQYAHIAQPGAGSKTARPMGVLLVMAASAPPMRAAVNSGGVRS